VTRKKKQRGRERASKVFRHAVKENTGEGAKHSVTVKKKKVSVSAPGKNADLENG